MRNWLGTFAEYFVLPAERAHKLPKELDYDLAVLAEPLAVGAHAVRIAHMKRGSVCAVLGGGTIGLLAGVAAQAAGAKRVYCTDVNRFRLDLAAALGLVPLKADEVPVEETVKSFAPNGADVVLVAFTSLHVINQALRLVKRGGTIIVIALFTEPVTFDMNLLQEEVELKGTIFYTGEDFQRALKILAKRKAELRKMLTHQVDLEGVQGALEMLGDPHTAAVKVIVHP
jgi:L-iditol 2-dehydrogenase